MRMKVKELLEVLPTLDPEAIIQIAGNPGFVNTENGDNSGSNVIMSSQETSVTHDEHYVVIDVPAHINKYDKLVIFKNYTASPTDVPQLFTSSFSGMVLLDTLLRTGEGHHRFLEMRLEHGLIDHDSVHSTPMEHFDPVRRFSDRCLRHYLGDIETNPLTMDFVEEPVIKDRNDKIIKKGDVIALSDTEPMYVCRVRKVAGELVILRNKVFQALRHFSPEDIEKGS